MLGVQTEQGLETLERVVINQNEPARGPASIEPLPVEHPPDRVGVEEGQWRPQYPEGHRVVDVGRGLYRGNRQPTLRAVPL